MRSSPVRLLRDLVVGAAVLVLAVAVLAVPLSAAGLWRPWLVLPAVLVCMVAVGFTLRHLPTPPLGQAVPTALLALLAVLATTWWVATSSEQVLPRRDSGTYVLTAQVLADTGRRVVPLDLPPDLVAVPDVTASSPGFPQVGEGTGLAVEPQFVIAPAAVWSLGVWADTTGWGLGAVPLLAALAMAFSLVGVGLLVSRWVGPWWGPVAVALLSVTFPVVHTARSAFSENLAMLVLVAAGLTLAEAPRSRTSAALTGVLLGGAGLVRVDAPRELLLVLPVLALSARAGQRWPRTVLVGAAAGLGVSVGAALLLSRTYLGGIADSVVPLLVLLVVSAGISHVVARPGSLAALRRGARRAGPWLPRVAALAVVAVGVLLASRPWWWVGHQSSRAPSAGNIAGIQLREGLPVDRTRTYTEQSVGWLAWWQGAPALVTGLAALAMIARNAVVGLLGRRVPAWLAPVVVLAGSTLLTLLRPGITPDHPWAERRLLIPTLLVAVLVVVAARWLLDRPWPRLLAVGAAALTLSAAAVPAVLATWPHRSLRVEAGEPTLVREACAGLREQGVNPRHDLLVAVDDRAANEWPEVLRARCAVPALSLVSAARRDPARRSAALDELARVAASHGLRVRLVAAEPETVASLERPTQLVRGTVFEDQHLLLRRPDGLDPLDITLWLSGP